jgi:F-type H+-transporting ATPase subunit delta
VKHRRAAASYAKALFAAAKERNQAEVVSRELGDMAETFESDGDLRAFFARPWVPPSAKRAVAMEVARRSDFSKLASDFLGLLAERGRTDYLRTIDEKYERLLDADLGRVRVQVRTGVPLTGAQREMLAAKLAQALGGRHAVLTEVVDRAVLGGFIAESGSVVVDGSLEGQLERMRRRLASGGGDSEAGAA